MKTKRLEIRLTEEQANLIKLSAKYHNMTATDFILQQCTKTEFVIIDHSNLIKTYRVLSGIGNNINQIAHALNSLKGGNDKLSESQYQAISESFEQIKSLYDIEDNNLTEAMRESYRYTKRIKKREIDLPELDGGNSATL